MHDIEQPMMTRGDKSPLDEATRAALSVTKRGRAIIQIIEVAEEEADPGVLTLEQAAQCYDARSGRRTMRNELEARMRQRLPDPTNTAREVKLAPRAVRRAVAKKNGTDFKPVVGHGIPAPDHKSWIVTLRVKDKARKISWFRREKETKEETACN